MNSSPLPRGLSITYKQAQRLIYYIQMYRRFSWENVEPTAERNAVLRALQALHGRIMSRMEQQSESITIKFSIMPDELQAMRLMISHVLDHYERSTQTRERTLAITELTGLKSMLDSDFLI